MNVETVVVGAGPAGLAVGACLRRAGREVVILERDAAVGSSWRHHYERLHLHTTRRGSALPFRPLPRDWPRYPSRAQVVEYLDDYARAFELAPRFGETVTRARRDGERWQVATSAGSYETRHLVIASGYNAQPVRPAFEGEQAFAGAIVHSSEYRNAEPYRDRRVLVVGAGNTGAEIALDLCEHGAAAVDLCVRGPIHIVRRDILGIPAQTLAVACRWIPRRILDVMFGWLARLTVGDLWRYGISRPRERILAQLESHGRIPMLDVGTIAVTRARSCLRACTSSASATSRPGSCARSRARRRGSRARSPPRSYTRAVMEATDLVIKLLTDFRADMNARFEQLDKRLDKRFRDVEKRFGGMEGRFSDIDRRFENFEKRQDRLEQRLSDFHLDLTRQIATLIDELKRRAP